MGQAAFLHNLFFFKAMTTIFTPMNRHCNIPLAGADLDILFRGGGGVDLLTDSHIYTHNYSINKMLSWEVITHKIDELYKHSMGKFVHKYFIYVR